jgi:hypothetical protein
MASAMVDGYDFEVDMEFGHFEEIEESKRENNRRMARNFWLSRLNIPENRPRTEYLAVLNTVRIVNPSISMKVESCSRLSSSCMDISSCINGIRIVQLKSGSFRAEYQMLFCCGSMSYSKWKSFDEFRELAKFVKYISENYSKPNRVMYEQSLKEWENVEKNARNWFGNMEISYLIEMSCRLGSFIQELLLESVNPRLLLLFIRNEDFIVE